MNSQKTVKKTEEFHSVKSEAPLDPFAVDIFGAGKPDLDGERETSAGVEEAEVKDRGVEKKRRAWNANLPVLNARQVEFSSLLRNLPKHLTRRAAAVIEETIARCTFQSTDEVNCRPAAVTETNLSEAIEKRAQTPQIFLTLGCQPENGVAVIALNADFASKVIDLILGGESGAFVASGDLSPVETVIIEFLGVNILSEINKWLGQTILCLQKVASEIPTSFDEFERGAASVFSLNFSSFGGTIAFFSDRKFLDGLDKTRNPLFEKKTPREQIKTLEKIALKLNLRVPIGTTRLTADSLLYLEPGDVILIEETENTITGEDFFGDLKIYVGSGKNFRLSGTSAPDETQESGELSFKINEITSVEEREHSMPEKLQMDEKEIEETEEIKGIEETEENVGGDAVDEVGQTDIAADESGDAAILSSVLVSLRVEIAGGKISLNELQSLRAGQIIPLGCRATDPVQIVADGSDQPIAVGELVDVEGKLGVRLFKIYI